MNNPTNGRRGIFCRIGLHSWKYMRNNHGGRPMFRTCSRCGRLECWDYDQARRHGAIVWVKVPADAGAKVSASISSPIRWEGGDEGNE